MSLKSFEKSEKVVVEIVMKKFKNWWKLHKNIEKLFKSLFIQNTRTLKKFGNRIKIIQNATKFVEIVRKRVKIHQTVGKIVQILIIR